MTNKSKNKPKEQTKTDLPPNAISVKDVVSFLDMTISSLRSKWFYIFSSLIPESPESDYDELKTLAMSIQAGEKMKKRFNNSKNGYIIPKE